MSKHEIASSGAYGARCTCGHIERSILGRLAALTQLMEHLETAEDEARQVIPEAAVEAAAEVAFNRHGAKYYSPIGAWADLEPRFRTAWIEDARQILEAAAPHFSSAWHDAVSNAYVDGALSADQANVMYNANPYRVAK